MAWNAEDDEARFRADVAEGHRWVLWAAGQLAVHGLTCQVPEPQIRPTFGERLAYRDHGDIVVTGSCGTTGVEVKAWNFRFDSYRNWPWPHVLLEGAKVMDVKLTHSQVWLHVSKPRRAILGVVPSQRRIRIVKDVWNERRQMAFDWAAVDVNRLMSFEAVVEYLHQAGPLVRGREPGQEG